MRSAEELQQRLYFLHEQLQQMARKLPLYDCTHENLFITYLTFLCCPRQFQQRMPYELLSGLANCLLNDTIFEIVEGLTEIQQVTEKQLLHQRLQLLHKHRG